MRIWKVLMFAILGLTGLLQAQTSHGYAYIAPGGATANGYTSMTLNLGFGGEARIASHVGAGAELAALGFTRSYTDSVMGVFSPNGYLHIDGSKDAKFDPFVTAGYSLFFRSGHENLFNFGGGVNIWRHKHLGFKIEFRDHVSTNYDTIHFWGLRFGLTFR